MLFQDGYTYEANLGKMREKGQPLSAAVKKIGASWIFWLCFIDRLSQRIDT